MSWSSLIPSAEAIPAPWFVLEALDILLFIIHLLFMNVVLGGSLILLYARLRGKDPTNPDSLHNAIVHKIPTVIALAVNFGVAPLLFLQVLYGHLMYSSSVLMAVYWLLVIPLLILAYYGAYIYGQPTVKRALSTTSLVVSTTILLYIAFTFVNNMTLMVQPDKWTAYFANRAGTILNLSDTTLIPRYLHFVTAAIAVAGLFCALVWSIRESKGQTNASSATQTGLRIFAIATSVQFVIGFWFLLVLPPDIRMAFLGQNGLYTLILFIGIGLGIASAVTAFTGHLKPTIALLIATIIFMVLNRALLRAAYLGDFFTVDSLELVPQYGVMALFLIVLVIGLIALRYMIKLVLAAERKEVTP